MAGYNVRAFTDGCCRKNGSGAWAAYIEKANDAFLHSGTVRGTTTQRMELTAILKALQALRYCTYAIELYTDSQYAAYGYNRWSKVWREKDEDGNEKWLNSQENPVANQDLWKQIFAFLDPMSEQVTVTWIRRNTHEGNVMADAAASHVRQLAENLRERNGKH